MISEDVLKLGSALAAELDDTDTLGRWMAHHLSDLLNSRDTSADADRDAEIADVVLGLWAHRAAAPLRHTPLLRYTEILRTLDRIDRLASRFPSLTLDDKQSRSAGSEFEQLAHDLLTINVAVAALSSALVTELQNYADNDESSWRPYSYLLGGDEHDEALRVLLNRVMGASASPEERRADIIERIHELEGGARAARETMERIKLAEVGSGAENARAQTKQRPRKRHS